MRYTYENIEKAVLKKVCVSKETSNFLVALYDYSVSLYSLDFNKKNIKLVDDVEDSFLLFLVFLRKMKILI